MATVKRAAMYLRVSTDRQTTDNQRRVLAEVAERRGWTVTTAYEDAGISGAKGRDAAAVRRIDVLVDRPAAAGTDPISVLHVILHGATANRTQLAPTDPDMPAFDWKLSDVEVAAVATFIRTT
jgi:hypothetical protein